MSTDYVLGTDQEELERLNLQHELWKVESIKVWDRIGFKRGDHIMDLGCGPGFTSLELAKRVGRDGSITAVDVSEKFLKHLDTVKGGPHLGKIETVKSYIEELSLQKKDFDGAYCRWLMIFVQDPQKALKSIYNHLKSGAFFSLQEYVAYESMALAPEEPIMEPVVGAIFKSWRDQGGDPNRGRDLPTLLEKAGFKNIQIEPLIRFARPSDPLWAWPESFYHSFIPRMVQTKYLTQEQADEFFRVWKKASQQPNSFFIAPTMINITAQKI